MTAQGRALKTKYQAIKILQAETDSKCRLYETIDHIISACPVQYLNRHDRVCA
jgi:hypothetical protein